MVIRLREVVGIIEGAFIFTCALNWFDNTASNGGTSVVVLGEVVFTKSKHDGKSPNVVVVVLVGKRQCSLLPPVVGTTISVSSDVTKISCIFLV